MHKNSKPKRIDDTSNHTFYKLMNLGRKNKKFQQHF